MKIKIKAKYIPLVLSGLLLIGIVFSYIQLTKATAPDPGHAWSDIDSVPLPINRGGLNTSTAVLKGDILVGTANGDFFHLPTSGPASSATSSQVLTVSSTATNGVAWSTNFSGWDFLGSSQSCSSGCTVNIPVRDVLMIVVRVTGYGGSDIASLQFNNDSGADYWTRHLVSAAASTTFSNTQNTGTTLLRIAQNGVQTNGRIATIICSNYTRTHPCTMDQLTDTGSASTAGLVDLGYGEWVTSTQITSVKLTTASGQTLNSGTGVGVWGRNL